MPDFNLVSSKKEVCSFCGAARAAANFDRITASSLLVFPQPLFWDIPKCCSDFEATAMLEIRERIERLDTAVVIDEE